MFFQKLLAIFIGKSILGLIQLLGLGGGFAAPGYYALKFYPTFLTSFKDLVPKTVVVTGTNGKTTTSRMIAHLAQQNQLRVVRNSTGSNLERGLVSQLLKSYSIWELMRGQSHRFDLAIWEVDEAAFNSIIPKIKPDLILFLNIYRDQLDRYGEIDSVVKKWCQTLLDVDSNCQIIINGDDPNLDPLADSFSGQISYFGVSGDKIEGEKSLHKLKPKTLNYLASAIKIEDLKSTHLNLKTPDQSMAVNLPLPGLYHVYDLLAASAVVDQLNLPLSDLNQHLKNFAPAFGRVEEVKLPGGKIGYIFLIKNPTGATQVLQTLQDQIGPQDKLLLALNDNFADGTDVSWIWDVNFELLISSLLQRNHTSHSGESSRPESINRSWTSQDDKKAVFITGTRASDLALRLKYAGLNPELFDVEPNLKSAFVKAKQNLEGKLLILPTYTALLELQKILKDFKIKQPYWREN